MHRKTSFFKHVGNEDLSILERNKYLVSYKSGEVICKEGTKPFGLICLNKGKVKIVKTNLNGKEQIVGLIKAVDYIGFRALLSNSHCYASHICLEDCSVCVIDRAEFFRLISKYPEVTFDIIRDLSKKLIEKDKRIISMSQNHMRERLIEALLLIDTIYGINPDTGYLNTQFKRHELAGLANISTSNVIRGLSALAREDLIKLDHRNIKLTNPDRLRSMIATQ
jgi:CRP-like cAMP-binding protein